MGKSVIGNDPFAYKPEYNQQVSGAKVVAPPNSKAGENDPFAYRPEYNADVKKKVGGTESEIGITEPSPTQSELQSKKENATNFLITDINQNDFFSKLASQTDQYFSHTTPQRVNEQAASVTQNEVFRNPASLQRYTDQRIKDINEELTNIEREKNKLQENKIIGADVAAKVTRSITDQKRYDELARQAIEKEQYKKQLKNNVAELAADQILSQMDLSGDMDLGKIGRQVSSIADPEQEAIFKMAEKGGKTLPGIRREQMNYTGLQAIKSYLSRNPEVPNYDQIVKNVNDLESDFDERNPQTTALRVKEKIGAQLYKEGKSSFFGFGYSPSTLKDAANNPETALTNSERKIFNEVVLPTERRLVGTDIPTSGFTRSFYNAIEKGGIGMGKTLGDVTGLRDESDQAADVLMQEQAGSRYRPAGESPTAQGQLAYLSAKEKTGKLTEAEQQQKKELENYTYVRNGWSKFKDGVGDLTGQVAMIALATKGLGSVGKALMASGAEGGLLGGMTRSAIGQALSNETVGLFTTSYLNAYDNYRQQAIQLMPKESQAANRNAYATVMASVEALSERIFRDTKILDAFTSGVAPTIRTITNQFINREMTQAAAREATQKALASSLKTFGKEYIKATGQESFEEAVVDVAQGIADSVLGGQSFDLVKTGQQALNTFLTTALHLPIVSSLAARGAMRRKNAQNSFFRSAIVDMAANPAQYLQSVEDLQLDGAITQQEANEKIKLIKSANQYLQEIPLSRTITRKPSEGKETQYLDQNKSFDYPETSSYLLHRLNEGILTEQINNTTDEVLKSKLNKDLKRSQEIRKGLFDGSIGVTPDLNEVTDNDEKADELGIFNINQVPPDELIGTLFEKFEIEFSIQKIEQNRKLDLAQVDEKIRNAGGDLFKIQKLKEEEQGINDYYNRQLKELDEKKSENKTAETSPTEGQPEAAQTEISEIPKITVEQEKEASDFANELLNEDIIPDGYKGIAKNSPIEFWQFVAQQAQNVDANWQPLSETDAPLSEQAAIDAFGETIVSYAKELFPISKLSNKKSTEIQEVNKKISEIENRRKQELDEPLEAKVLYESIKENESSPYDIILPEARGNKTASLTRPSRGVIDTFELTEEEMNELNKTDGRKAKVAFKKKIAARKLNEINEEINKKYDKEISELTTQQKKEENEKQVSQEASPQKSGEEIIKPEAASEGNESKGDEVLTEQGAEPIAEAPLELTDEEIQKPLEATRAKKVSGALRDFATKIQKVDITGAGGTSAQSDITRVPRETMAFAINRVADAIDAGEAVVNAIQKGVDYIREQGHKMDDDSFKSYTADLIAGKKPRIRVSIEPQKKSSEKKQKAIKPTPESDDNLVNRKGVKYSNIFIGDKGLEDIIDDNKLTKKEKEIVRGIFERHISYFEFNENEAQKWQEKSINPEDINEVADLRFSITLNKESDFYDYNDRNYSNVKDTINYIIQNKAEYSESVVKAAEEIKDRLESASSGNRLYAIDLDKILGIEEENKPQTKEKKEESEEKEPKQERKEPPRPPKTPPTETTSGGEGGSIDDYEMTTSGEVNRFLSGNTWEDVFGERAEGDQNFLTQKLSDMLQDGKNMIAIAQQRWGGDVMMYAKPLFQFIQAMSNDRAMDNKKAVLLATFLGELQEAKKRSPERFDAISQIEKAVFSYYQNYMNVRGKEIVAGRLLRLYRDKYIGDIYADMILEKEQVKAKKAIQDIEQNVQIDDKTASEETKPVTEEEKKKEDKAAKKKSETAKKEQTRKKKMTADEAKQRADNKVREIEEKMGKDGRGGLIDRIKGAIKKLNCK